MDRIKLLRIAGGVSAALFTLILLRKLAKLSQSQHSILIKNRTTAAPIPDIFPQFIRNTKGLWLYTRSWEIPNPRAIIFISHGYGEHSGRYDHIARQLNLAGYSAYAIDHQGHGLSDGDRAFVPRWQDLIDDFIFFVKDRIAKGPNLPLLSDQKQSFSDLPRFLIGHSMGALISIHVTHLASDLFRGTLLSGPPLYRDPDLVPDWLYGIAKFLSRTLPKLRLKALPLEGLSRESQVQKRYELDPLVILGGMRARTAVEMLSAVDQAIKFAPQVTWPYLLLHGGQDKICNPLGSEAFHRQALSSDKQLKIYPGAFHEIFQETNRNEVWADMLEWIRVRLH